MSRRSRWHRAWRRPRVSLSQRRLYRDPARGRLAGVCAGLADYFQVSRTMMRFIAVTALIFAPQLTLIAYVIAIFFVPTRQEVEDTSTRWDEVDGTLDAERARQRAFDERMRQAEFADLDTQRRAAHTARERLTRIDGRLRTLEAYVTSRRFDLDREFGKL